MNTALNQADSWLNKNPVINIYLLPVIWALVIFVFSSQATLPSLSFSFYDFLLKKAAHIMVYAVLFILINRSLLLKNMPSNKSWKVAFFITLLYALSDELHQTLIPGRFGSVRDVGYDMLGASLAFMWKYRYI